MRPAAESFVDGPPKRALPGERARLGWEREGSVRAPRAGKIGPVGHVAIEDIGEAPREAILLRVHGKVPCGGVVQISAYDLEARRADQAGQDLEQGPGQALGRPWVRCGIARRAAAEHAGDERVDARGRKRKFEIGANGERLRKLVPEPAFHPTAADDDLDGLNGVRGCLVDHDRAEQSGEQLEAMAPKEVHSRHDGARRIVRDALGDVSCDEARDAVEARLSLNRERNRGDARLARR